MTFLYGLLSPSPVGVVSGLSQVLLVNDTPFLDRCVVVISCQCLVFLLIWENTKYKRNAIPCIKVIEFRPELSSRPDW